MKLPRTYWFEFSKDDVRTLYTICHIAKANGEERAERFMKLLEKSIKEN